MRPLIAIIFLVSLGGCLGEDAPAGSDSVAASDTQLDPPKGEISSNKSAARNASIATPPTNTTLPPNPPSPTCDGPVEIDETYPVAGVVGARRTFIIEGVCSLMIEAEVANNVGPVTVTIVGTNGPIYEWTTPAIVGVASPQTNQTSIAAVASGEYAAEIRANQGGGVARLKVVAGPPSL